MKHPIRDLRRHVLSDLHYGLETGHGKDWVAIILATALSTGVVFIVIGAYTIQFTEHVPTSDNAAQLIGNIVAGIVAILGSYVGYRASRSDDEAPEAPPD